MASASPSPIRRVASIAIGSAALVTGIMHDANAQPSTRWPIHSTDRPQPRVVKPPANSWTVAPPADATVLIGTDLSRWEKEGGGAPGWKVENGYVEVVPGAGGIVSRDAFGDVRLHVEFATPTPAHGEGQDRGNSGVFLMGHYEIQVLDSWKSATYPDGQCGAVYGQNPPLVNASRPPGEWQTYDITFTAPKFDDKGNVLTPARVTVLLNNVKVQDNFELFGETGWRHRATYHAHGPTGPLVLQDHGHPVRYRNIWFVPVK